LSAHFSALPGPSADTDSPPLDLIFIDGFIGHTVIGIHTSELHEPQPLVIDICAGTPRSPACDSDNIAHTLDYSVLRERLHVLLREHRVQLLEAFAEQVATIVLQEFGALWVRVRVAKPRKFEDVASVGVQIERRRTASAPHGAQRGAAVLQLIASGMVPGQR
jgi:dihydroneopterin aldolase